MKIFCLKCQKKTNTDKERVVVTKNHRNMVRGVCTCCDTKKCLFITDDDATKIKKAKKSKTSKKSRKSKKSKTSKKSRKSRKSRK